jgi:hypothetical protein
MSDNSPEVMAKLREFQRRIEAAETNAEKNAIAKESMDFYREAGKSVPIESLEGAITFAQQMVDRVLSSIIFTADQMGEDRVPVFFLKELKAEIGAFIAAQVWESAEMLGVPLDYGTPDDLSGLLGDA